jgi:hypothetical protein
MAEALEVMPNSIFDRNSYPWHRPEAVRLYRALVDSVTEPAEIDLRYRMSSDHLPPLKLHQAPSLIWKDALEQIASHGALRRFVELCLGEPIYDIHEASRLMLEAAEAEQPPADSERVAEQPPADSERVAELPPADRVIRRVRLFYSYSHQDKKFRERLEIHLAALRRQGLIEDWHDRKITAGREWKNDIDDNLEAADVILLLVSPDFLASDYAYNREFKRALERHKLGEVRVVPIILRYSDWQETPIGELQALPLEGRPVAGRGDRAWMEVTKGLRQVIKEVQKAR